MKKTILGIAILLVLLFAMLGCTQQTDNQLGDDQSNELNENTLTEESAVIDDTITDLIDETQEPEIGEMY